MKAAASKSIGSSRRLLVLVVGFYLALAQVHLAGATLRAPLPRTEFENAPRVLASWKDVSIRDYWWAPDGIICVLSTEAGGKESYSTYGTRTGKLITLAALDKARVSADMEPSPNGRCFLCVDHEDAGETYWRVMDVSGRESVRSKATKWYPGMRGIWLPNSRGWAEVTGGSDHTEFRLFSIHPNSRIGPYTIPGGFAVTAFADPRTVLLTTSPRYTEGDRTAVRTCRLNEDGSLTVGHSGMFGVTGAVVRSVALSPDGRRLCWLTFEQTPLQTDKYDRLSATVYTTTDSCTDVRKIARVELSANIHSWNDSDLTHTQMLIPTRLKWAPDGRSVTYLLQGNIWTVPLPGPVRAR